MSYIDIITIISLILAVIALAASTWQLRQASIQTRELSAINESLSTQFLGLFPDFNREIARLIDGATASIEIFCDLPGYGMVTNYDAWHEISRAIHNAKMRNIYPKVSVFDNSQMKSIIIEQAKYIENSGGNITSDCADTLEKRFSMNVEDFSMDAFADKCLQEHNAILNHEFRGCEIKRVTKEIPIYFWLIDRREAIISIPLYSDQTTEYGFKTRDAAFIAVLKSMRSKIV